MDARALALRLPASLPTLWKHSACFLSGLCASLSPSHPSYPSLTPALGPTLIAPRHRRPLVPSRVQSTQATQRGYRPLITQPTPCLPLNCDLCTSCIQRVSASTNRPLICLSTSGRPIFAGIYSALHQLVSPAITFSFIVHDTCIIPIQKRLQSSCLAFSFAAVISAVCNLSYPSLQMTTPPVVWCHVVA